jgi:hypothetical protein
MKLREYIECQVRACEGGEIDATEALQASIDAATLESDCRWAMAMLVNGIEGRLLDIHNGDTEKVLKAARRMPAYQRAAAWLEADNGRAEDGLHPLAEMPVKR